MGNVCPNSNSNAWRSTCVESVTCTRNAICCYASGSWRQVYQPEALARGRGSKVGTTKLGRLFISFRCPDPILIPSDVSRRFGAHAEPRLCDQSVVGPITTLSNSDGRGRRPAACRQRTMPGALINRYFYSTRFRRITKSSFLNRRGNFHGSPSVACWPVARAPRARRIGGSIESFRAAGLNPRNG